MSAERITRSVLAMPEFQNSESISCFLSMGDEVDTSGIIQAILTQGTLMAFRGLPVLLPSRQTRSLMYVIPWL